MRVRHSHLSGFRYTPRHLWPAVQTLLLGSDIITFTESKSSFRWPGYIKIQTDNKTITFFILKWKFISCESDSDFTEMILENRINKKKLLICLCNFSSEVKQFDSILNKLRTRCFRYRAHYPMVIVSGNFQVDIKNPSTLKYVKSKLPVLNMTWKEFPSDKTISVATFSNMRIYKNKIKIIGRNCFSETLT